MSAVCTSETSGSINSTESINSFFSLISGITCTPALNPAARMNGACPNAGSSAITISSALTLPEKIERLNFPIVTFRPSAFEASASSSGRNWSASRNSGMTSTINNSAPAIASPIFMFLDIAQTLSLPHQCLPRRGIPSISNAETATGAESSANRTA